MDLNKIPNWALAEFYAKAARSGAKNLLPALLYSETVAEDKETVTDCGYFAVLLLREEAKEKATTVAICKETTVYAREENGDPGKPISTKTEILETA